MIAAFYIIIRLLIVFTTVLSDIKVGKTVFILSVLYPFLFWFILKINSLLALFVIWAFPIPMVIFALKKCSIKKIYLLNLLELLLEYITVWIPSAINSADLINSFSAEVYFFDFYLFSL